MYGYHNNTLMRLSESMSNAVKAASLDFLVSAFN